MTTHQTIDGALNHLMYTTSIIRLKQKLNFDFIQHDKELTYLQENCEDIAAQKLIDKYASRYNENFFDAEEE